MSKYVFTPGEKYGVWEAHGRKCRWCSEPIVFKECEIDHIIPESLATQQATLSQVKIDLGLGADFQLNSFKNWVPICGNCNKQKSNKTFQATPLFLNVLADAAANEDRAMKIAARFNADGKYGSKIFALIQAGQKAGELTKEFWDELKADVEDFYKGEPQPQKTEVVPVTREVSFTRSPHGVELELLFIDSVIRDYASAGFAVKLVMDWDKFRSSQFYETCAMKYSADAVEKRIVEARKHLDKLVNMDAVKPNADVAIRDYVNAGLAVGLAPDWDKFRASHFYEACVNILTKEKTEEKIAYAKKHTDPLNRPLSELGLPPEFFGKK